MDTRDLNNPVIMTIIQTGVPPHTVVQEPTWRLLCISGECSELIFRQIILMGISAATLIHGFLMWHRKISASTLTSLEQVDMR